MVAALAIGLTIGEVVAITAGVAVLLQRDGYEPREALPVALVSALGLLEAAMVIGGLLAIRRHGMEGRLLAAMRAHLHAEWKTWAVVAPAWAYLAAAAVFIPESNFDSMRYNLARVLLFEQEGTLLLPYVSDWSQVVFPVGGDLLRHYVLRFGTDFGLALFNVAALVAMATGSYALGRSVATRAAALTAMLILSGAPGPSPTSWPRRSLAPASWWRRGSGASRGRSISSSSPACLPSACRPRRRSLPWEPRWPSRWRWA